MEQEDRIISLFTTPPAKGLFNIHWQLIPMCDVEDPKPGEIGNEWVAFLAHRRVQFQCCRDGACGQQGHNLTYTLAFPLEGGLAKEIRPTYRSLFALLQGMLATVHSAKEAEMADEPLSDEEKAIYQNYAGLLTTMLIEDEFAYLTRLEERVNFDVHEKLELDNPMGGKV